MHAHRAASLRRSPTLHDTVAHRKDCRAHVLRTAARRHPLRAVFRDSGFASDAARINAEQIFREVSPETDVRAI